MGLTLSQKIIKNHLVCGKMLPEEEIGIKIDQTLTQDATGTMAYLQLEAMKTKRVKTELSAAYIDHNTLQNGFENADDHCFIRSVAAKRGVKFSRPGNGICHQVHLERFGIPGKTLLGSDSHTPTGGGVGMLAIGAGGLDVAVAMSGGTYYLPMPYIVKIELNGSLMPWVSAKDIILEVLRIMSVKGGVGKIIEYSGEGVSSLSVPERATITNMGAELGATTSIFPSDCVTKEFLKAQNRENDYIELFADADAKYDETIAIDLSSIIPLAALPHMPDKVEAVADIGKIKIDQVCIGSCTNSSLYDMLKTAAILKGKTVAPDVSLTISPGSRQVLNMLASSGALADMIAAGARILECACGPCIGMGQSPKSKGVSLRTFNRNFEGRSGAADAEIYLVSPETAAASAINGYFTDPRTLGKMPEIHMPDKFLVDDNMILAPDNEEDAKKRKIEYGPNIKAVPMGKPLEDKIKMKAIVKVGDNITTDHIMPAGAKILPYRSNIPYLSKFCFGVCDASFPERCLENGGGIIIGGANYGQGSSREHAALVPLYLGIKAVIAKSFARMHKANLINSGIIPLTFKNPDDYGNVSQDDELVLDGIKDAVADKSSVTAANRTNGKTIELVLSLSNRERKILLAGGMLKLMSNK